MSSAHHLRDRRGGFALVAALLLVLLLALLGAAMLTIGTQHRRVARLHASAVRARHAAEAGVRIAAAAWTPSLDTLVAGAAVPQPAAAGTWPDASTRAATIARLGGGAFLLEGRGTSADGATARAAARLEVADALRMWADASAAITTGGALELRAGAIIDGTLGPAPPGWGAAECPPEAANERSATLGAGDLPGVLADSAALLTIDPAASVAGAPPIQRAPLLAAPTTFTGLAGFRAADLAVIADQRVGGMLVPGPVSIGAACDTAATGNWGDPLAPGSPCGGYRPLVVAPADLHIAGGVGQGVLVVFGNLTVSGPFEFRGLVLVGGGLDITAASFHGALRVLGGTSVSRFDGSIRHDGCSLWRAFHAPALRRPFRSANRWWIPVF